MTRPLKAFFILVSGFDFQDCLFFFFSCLVFVVFIHFLVYFFSYNLWGIILVILNLVLDNSITYDIFNLFLNLSLYTLILLLFGILCWIIGIELNRSLVWSFMITHLEFGPCLMFAVGIGDRDFKFFYSHFYFPSWFGGPYVSILWYSLLLSFFRWIPIGVVLRCQAAEVFCNLLVHLCLWMWR